MDPDIRQAMEERGKQARHIHEHRTELQISCDGTTVIARPVWAATAGQRSHPPQLSPARIDMADRAALALLGAQPGELECRSEGSALIYTRPVASDARRV